MAPFLAEYDRALDYLQQRRRVYDEGGIPAEDEGLRTLIKHIAGFAKQVEAKEQFGNDESKVIKIDKLIQD